MKKLFLEAKVKALKEGEFEVVASTGAIDRLGDTINPKGWFLKNYKENPVILWAHNNNEPPIAKAKRVWIEGDKQLMIKGEFASTQFAQELKTLVEGGFLNAVSVGFLPLIEDEKGLIDVEGKMYRRALEPELKAIAEKGYKQSGVKFDKQELLEISWVDVPALPQALISARGLNLNLITKELETIKSERIACNCKELVDEFSEIEIKPYPNEHSCRLEDPGKYDKFARKNCEVKHDGKCIDFIFGITGGKSELQAMRYKKDIWTAGDARNHCKDKGGSFEPASEANLNNEEQILKIMAEQGQAISGLKEELRQLSEKVVTLQEPKGRKQSANQKTDVEKMVIMIDQLCEALIKKLREKR